MNPNRQHQKCKAPKMEVMKINTCYAVTLSPPDRRTITGAKMCKGNDLETFKTLEMNINEDLQLFKKLKYSKIEVYPELSPTGRLHYHGYIEIHNVLKFYYHDTHILNQISYEIDTISEDPEGIYKYEQYVLKQQQHFKEFLDYANIQTPIKN